MSATYATNNVAGKAQMNSTSSSLRIRSRIAFACLAAALAVGIAPAHARPGHHGSGHSGYGHHYSRYGHHSGAQYSHHGRHSGLHYSWRGRHGGDFHLSFGNHQGHDIGLKNRTAQRYGSSGYESPYLSSPPRTGGTPGSSDTYPAPSDRPASIAPDNELGWRLLSDGDSSEALHHFADWARRNPTVGAPMVGFALTYAVIGVLRQGVWAMRRAFRVDPESTHYIVIDDKLRPRIRTLLERYQGVSAPNNNITDAAFMLASLHYLLRDLDHARSAIERASEKGDRTESTANLARQIEKAIAEQPTSAGAGQGQVIGNETDKGTQEPPYRSRADD